MEHSNMEKLHESGPSGLAPKIMPLELLKQITNNFSEEQKLGSGTFGKVYKGVHNGEEIAVKMLHLMPGHDDLEQFKSEFENLRRLRHQNIVQLLGYCYEIKLEYVELSDGRAVFGQNIYRALCFQYMQEGSLRKHLCDESRGLDWQTRYKIIKGICEGLKYLQEGMGNPIYHLDLKPENILLDKDMVPKLADFGLSKLVTNDHTRSTQSSIGTMGYLPPEYIERNLVSKKYDIFSLGVVMIQIISGENGYCQCADMSPQEFINLVLQNWRNRLEETPRCTSLEAECYQVKRTIEIALDCIRADRKKRPEIGNIVNWLNETEQMIKKMTLEVESMAIISVAPSSPQQITRGPMGPMETSTEGLDVYPLDIWFPLESDKVIKCPVTLTNKTDNLIGVLVAPTSLDACFNPGYSYVWEHPEHIKKDARISSIFRSLEPHSSETIYMTMRKEEQRLLEATDKGMFDVLMVATKSKTGFKGLGRYWNHGTWKKDKSEDPMRRAKELGTVVHLATVRAAVTSDPTKWHEVQLIQTVPDEEHGYIWCMDVHPTKTWLLMAYCPKSVSFIKFVSIWNYETQEIVTKFEVKYLKEKFDLLGITSVKFIAGEQWFVVGDNIGGVHVYAYTSFGAQKDKVKEFIAHDGKYSATVDSLAVYPKHTLLLTACFHRSSFYRESIKLWDWSQGWTCTRVINTHDHLYPRFKASDASTFASYTVSDNVIKVWDIHFPDAIATFEGSRPTFCTNGHQNFLATLSDDSYTESTKVKIWDLEANKHVHTLCSEIWGWNLKRCASHPTLPILAGIMEDRGGRTQRVHHIVLWDLRTYRVMKRVELPMEGDYPRMIFHCTEDITR